MARKTWILDSDTKGTGARVVPLETVLEQPEPVKKPDSTPRRPSSKAAAPSRPGGKPARRTVTKSALAPGQVRKKATGEIGRVVAVDPKAGTATVRWLRQGRTSTVALSSISRS